MDEPIYNGFTVLELSKIILYETYYDKLQPYFGQEKLQLHYMDCGSFVLSIKTQNIIHDFRNLENLYDFGNLDENHELISNRNKNIIGKFKIETPKNISADDFVCLRSRAYSIICNDKNTNKIKGISKSYSKNI